MYGEYRPDYIIKDAGNNGIFKVIHFKHTDSDYIRIVDEPKKENQNKLDNNICRTRSRVLELALCNEWEWFVTLTLDKDKYDRYDLHKFRADLSQWLRDKNKSFKHKNKAKLQYLLIPETHKDGAWHMHGLFNGIPYQEIADFIPCVHPENLIKSVYKNWPAYAKKFGFISMGRIRDKAKCAFYISKYITKDLSKRMFDLREHLYFSTQGLNEYENAAYVYGREPELDKLTSNHGEVCSTGYVFGEVETFPQRYSYDDEEKPVTTVKPEDIKETEFMFIADVITDDDLISFYDEVPQ